MVFKYLCLEISQSFKLEYNHVLLTRKRNSNNYVKRKDSNITEEKQRKRKGRKSIDIDLLYSYYSEIIH